MASPSCVMKIIVFIFFFFLAEIQKVLTKLSKEKGCEIIGRWKQACVRHFYWSVTSTTPKLGDVILAKFKAFLYHIINQHKDLPNQLFNKCAHGLITTPRVWLTKGIYVVHYELKSICASMQSYSQPNVSFDRVNCV